jgi:glycosyltransferase involved in cell wall biosynthesis
MATSSAKNRALLSVVITTRNSARTIGRCLASLVSYLEQGYISEVIVVDGHSTDGTKEIIERYPVTLLYKSDDAYRNGLIRAYLDVYNGLDIGWRASRGELVMFLDSDAYLGEGFFPQALEFFADERLGVLGWWAKAWVTTPHTKTMDQLWFFHGERIRALQNGFRHPFEVLYRLVTSFGAKRLATSGPCYIVRRSCLELSGGHGLYGDIGLSLRLQDRGWRSWWWVDAPVYDLPKENLGGLLRQRYFWGQVGACIPEAFRRGVWLPWRIAGAMLLAPYLAARFCNPRQLLALPLAEVSLCAGYVHGLIARARGKR